MLQLYDTRTRQVEPIEPARRRQLRMYACGPAVYRHPHLGDLRSSLLTDLIRRTAERHRLIVTTAQNISDVGHSADGSETGPEDEDTIIAQARAEGRSALDVAQHYEKAFRADCDALNIRPADFSARASESIDLMIDLIARLLETGHAYPAPGGSVYFNARSFASYGELSGNRPDDGPLGHRPRGQAGPGQRFHGDWVLWTPAAEGRELTWPAPWGTGFPSWAAQCSATSLRHLGEVIDVHTGPIGLRLPHDEQERAQSNTVTGHEVVQHWVHGERLLFEGHEMAPSAGNLVLVSDLEARGLDPLGFRLAGLEHRYRQPMNLTWAALEAADRTVHQWRERVAEWARSPSKAMCAQYVGDFNAAFDDDLDTPAALRVLRALEQDSEIPPGAKFETFAHLDHLLGLDLARDIGRDPAPRPLPAP